MAEKETCPHCGETLTTDSLEGLCARCLLSAAATDTAAQGPNLLPAPGEYFGTYHIIRRLGEGGMGVVYLAEREDAPNRQVALKMIGAGILHPRAVERFVEEREILGTLDHPNIARLIDGGVNPDGVPYMAMEYVDGVSLTEYCSIRKAPLRRRLELFRAICEAVHCAHQHLVVHRDIKPVNILVTGEGVPKLVDFGIAKVLDQSHEARHLTGTLMRPMTPDYASPEQLRGGQVTTATDIYSLGVVLYELLTGARPFRLERLELDEIFRTVMEQTPPRPSACAQAASLGVTEDLDAIAFKAMRKEPQERYASARELADDLTRYLEGLPVLARRGTFGYVARKLLTRYKAHAAAMTAGLVLAASGAATIGWEAHVANRERAKAQRRFDELHGLAKSVIFELHDGIARLPGSTELRKTLVSRALTYLNSLAADSEGDAALLTEVAAAYRRVGDVQGRSNHANLGDPEGALASYRKGLEAARAAIALDSRRDAALHEAGWLNLVIGEIFLSKGDSTEASSFMLKGLGLLRAQAIAPDAPAAQRSDFASALLDMALAVRQSDPGRARDYLKESADVYERILAAEPKTANVAYNAAIAHRYLAAFGDRSAALNHLGRALELDRMCVEADPSDGTVRLNLAVDLSEFGSREFDAGEFQTAITFDRQSLNIREELAAADPANVLAQNRLGFGHAALARDLAAAGDQWAASGYASRSIAIYSAVIRAHPAEVEARTRLTWVFAMLGEARWRLGDDRQACKAFREGIEAFEFLSHSGTAGAWAVRQRDRILRGLAQCPAE